MFKKTGSASEEVRHTPLRYVEPRSDARTSLVKARLGRLGWAGETKAFFNIHPFALGAIDAADRVPPAMPVLDDGSIPMESIVPS